VRARIGRAFVVRRVFREPTGGAYGGLLVGRVSVAMGGGVVTRSASVIALGRDLLGCCCEGIGRHGRARRLLRRAGRRRPGTRVTRRG
jgi:hypothetical protein